MQTQQTVIESAESIIRNLSPTEYSAHLLSLILQNPTLLGRTVLTVVLIVLGLVFSLFYVFLYSVSKTFIVVVFYTLMISLNDCML